ncbi:hypothetical protein [Streptomyces sp. NEAU-W12]|uniref:hypothetical protein n=1 Tax=Streptomyces sp. NEAU-W12 TaxID=2994668 RepID=UPI00224A5EAB|nr:hypothetical protein [Streptomyces sp. NEAU-W12]MCX2926913.1 hypothetical protein [Streptomyces sp. NEAU-W12]
MIVDFRVTGAVSAALEGVPAAWIVDTGFFSFPFPQVVRDVVPELERLGVPPETARRILGDVLCIPDWSRFDPLSGIDSAESGAALRSLDEIRHVGPVLKESPARMPSRAEARKRNPGRLTPRQPRDTTSARAGHVPARPTPVRRRLIPAR